MKSLLVVDSVANRLRRIPLVGKFARDIATGYARGFISAIVGVPLTDEQAREVVRRVRAELAEEE